MTGTRPSSDLSLRPSRRALLGSSGALAAGAVGTSLFTGSASAAPGTSTGAAA